MVDGEHMIDQKMKVRMVSLHPIGLKWQIGHH